MKHIASPFNIATAVGEVFTVSHNTPVRRIRPAIDQIIRHRGPATSCRAFHDYFVTHLPSSSLSPDRQAGPHHKLPRNESQPHTGSGRTAARDHSAANRDTTIVRIPIRSAKHHFGAGCSRGGRPYNEDTFQAGTIEIPAFAKRQPISLQRSTKAQESQSAAGESGDPQVFYFGVFDGHGGSECSEFLRDRLHAYIEEAALLFGMESSLQKPNQQSSDSNGGGGVMGDQDAESLQTSLVQDWKDTVGGYFKRFRPEWFPAVTQAGSAADHARIETILTYAFLKADLDFTTAQAAKHSATPEAKSPAPEEDPVLSDRPLNDNDLLFHPDRPASQNLHHRPPAKGSSPDLDAPIGGKSRFKGGSTASTALISTPTPTPFWHPAAPSTMVTSHVGDTRILLCRTSDGVAVSVTTNHHPDTPVEATRLRRYATAFSTDSFGDQRVFGLANTRAFGDITSKRVGVSAEPEIITTQIAPAEYSFVVLISDGVSGHLSDQEIVDIVKEERTPAQAAMSLINFATETSDSESGADNATALVVRLGGWERRNEGGGGSLGTKERRDFRKRDADDPRMRRQ